MDAAHPALVAVSRTALRRIRMRSGMSQVGLSKTAKISQGHLSHLENGTRIYASPELYSRLIAALGANYDDLLLTDEDDDETADAA